MTATVAGIHLGLDTHANRPAANTNPDGSLYSCSTHGLIYKSNYAGNSWATWATLGDAAIACYAVRSATQTIGTGSWTAISFTASDKFDTTTMHDPGGANPERIVPPVTGYYQCNVRAGFAAEATGDRYVSIYVAGAQYSSTDRQQANSTIGNVLFIADVLFLTATSDYVEGRVFQDAGANRTLSSATLSLAFVGT